MKLIVCFIRRVLNSSKVLHLQCTLLILFLSFFLSLHVSTDIRLMAMSRAASFDGQFALLLACHLYLLPLFIIAVF